MRPIVIVTWTLCLMSTWNAGLQAQTLFQYGENGRFNAEFNEQQCLLSISVRVTFTFQDGSANNVWTDSAKTAWKNDFMRDVQAHWSGRYRFKPSEAGGHIRRCDFVRVQVGIVEVDSGEHFRIKVKKVKSHDISSTRGGNVNLDSRDLERRDRGGRKQTGAFHEFGHMIGLPDEHGTGTSSQMSHGDSVGPGHYSTFEQALEELTTVAVQPAAP